LHRAAAPQLFIVIAGGGWVRGETDERFPITSGQAAFWEKGELHASGSESGMTVIVIEAEDLAPPSDESADDARSHGPGAQG
jgi:hypothetical protein